MYVDLLHRLEELVTENAMAGLYSCSFVTKRIKGTEYLYVQGKLADGTAKQVYLGLLDRQAKALVERFQTMKRELAPELNALDASAKALRAAGMVALDPVEWRIVEALAEEGVFRLGGVLMGSVAYRCIANTIGVHLTTSSALTADIDVGINTVSVAAVTGEAIRVSSALERLEMGFSPMREFDPILEGSRFKARDMEFKVEFLTPLIGSGKKQKYRIEQLGVTAIPLRFLDFVLEDTISAIALGRRPILVKVPQPARYAVHKLIVSQERTGADKLKSHKDLLQAWEIFNALKIVDPGAFEESLEAIRARGPGWKMRVNRGFRMMNDVFGE